MWDGQLLSLSVITGFLVQICLATYEFEKCYCHNEMNGELKQKLSEIEKKESFGLYQYSGIKFLTQNNAKECICSDVTRTKGNLIFVDYDVFEKSDTAPERNELIVKIKEILKELGKNNSLDDKLVDLKLTFVSRDANTNETTYEVEIIMKTMDEAINTETDAAFEIVPNENGERILSGVGRVKGPALKTTVVKCDGEPQPEEGNVHREWNKGRIPGSKAVYNCSSSDYVLDKDVNETESICGHDLKWTEIFMKCERGCNEDPPEPTPFMTFNFDRKERSTGSEVKYYCMKDYWPMHKKNHSSVCLDNSTWSPLPQDFVCEKIKCPREDIPQNGDFGRRIWNGKVVVGSYIMYYCMPGYSPSVKGNTTIVCQNNGNWSSLPDGFNCTNTITLLESGIIDYYDVYDNLEYPDLDEDYWLTVTVPSLAGIVAALLICLCLTRTDRFLFALCGCCSSGGKARSSSQDPEYRQIILV